jgi:hypothetical protein
MGEEYQRQIDNRETEIRGLNQRIDYNLSDSQSMIKKENDAYKQENRVLRDKVNQLTHELDNMGKSKSAS